MTDKQIVFDLRTKPAGRINGVITDKEENVNKFAYGKSFEIDSPSAIKNDVYHIEINVPAEFLTIEGKLHILIDGNKFYENNISGFTAGQNILDINSVITKGHSISAVLEYTNAKSLGHYTLHLKLESR